MTGLRALVWATFILSDLAVAFAVAFAYTTDARYLAATVASILAAYCAAAPIRQPSAEVQP